MAQAFFLALVEVVDQAMADEISGCIADPVVKVEQQANGLFYVHLSDPAQVSIITTRIQRNPHYVVADHHEVEGQSGVKMTVQYVTHPKQPKLLAYKDV